MTAPHQPVMVEAVLDLLAIQEDDRVIDATAGAGGHSEQIARRLSDRGALLSLDRDAEMLQLAEARLAPFGDRARRVHARFSSLADVAQQAGWDAADAVLLDLGLCSAQLDQPQRGFSFDPGALAAPLDMRMNASEGETAAELLLRLEEDELIALLRAGDVPSAGRVARTIRAALPIHTVQELNAVLRRLRFPKRKHHPATLVFQALRLAVNDEMHELETALERAVELLAPGGRLVVLSYHSGEDRRVKEFMQRESRGCICPPDLPVCGCGRLPRLALLRKATGADPDEVLRNPRARSARLRGARRTEAYS